MNERVKQQRIRVGPPALWSEWPRTLERAVRLRGLTARSRRTLMRWSTRIERDPARVYGIGAAIAFAFGVVLGLL